MNYKLIPTMFLLVFTLCLALMCVPLLASAQDAARQQVRLEAKETLQRLKIQSGTSVRARWHADRGTVRSLYNLTVPAPAGTPEASARQFLNTYRELFAMTDQNVDLRLKKVQHSLTAEHVRLAVVVGVERDRPARARDRPAAEHDRRGVGEHRRGNQGQHRRVVLSRRSD